MSIKTEVVDTKGEWMKVEDVFNITLVDNSLYSIQILGVAKLSYNSTVPEKDFFTINFPQPFTYEKKSGEDLYVKTEYVNGRTEYVNGVTFTIAG